MKMSRLEAKVPNSPWILWALICFLVCRCIISSLCHCLSPAMPVKGTDRAARIGEILDNRVVQELRKEDLSAETLTRPRPILYCKVLFPLIVVGACWLPRRLCELDYKSSRRARVFSPESGAPGRACVAAYHAAQDSALKTYISSIKACACVPNDARCARLFVFFERTNMCV